MCVIWGIPYLLIKVAVRDLSPAMLVFCRTGIGATVLLPVAIVRGDLAPLLARWRPLLVYTVVELAVPWVLLSTAEQKLPSSLTGLLVAAVPLIGFCASHQGSATASRPPPETPLVSSLVSRASPRSQASTAREPTSDR